MSSSLSSAHQASASASADVLALRREIQADKARELERRRMLDVLRAAQDKAQMQRQIKELEQQRAMDMQRSAVRQQEFSGPSGQRHFPLVRVRVRAQSVLLSGHRTAH